MMRVMVQKIVAPFTCMQVSQPLIWGIRRGCTETRWSKEAFAPGWLSDSFQIGWLSFDFKHQGCLCAVPKRQSTQIGQQPFKDTRRRGISPASAMVISFGHGKWCNRVWWLIISSSTCKSAFGYMLCSICKVVKLCYPKHNWKKSVGLKLYLDFQWSSEFQDQLGWLSHWTTWFCSWASCCWQSLCWKRSLCLLYLIHHCILVSYLARRQQDSWVSEGHQ